MVVVRGQFVQSTGLIDKNQSVWLHQKTVIHSPQGKVLEFLIAILTGAIHHLKVRTAPAIFLQEQFAVFAANFVRWAAHWLSEQCPQLPSGWQNTAQPKVKEQVKVGAHTSTRVGWQDHGCLLTFTDHSLFAGRSLSVKKQWVVQFPLPFSENTHF
jgi:hypothetical protein